MRKLVLLLALVVLLSSFAFTASAQELSELGQAVLDAHTECEVDLTGEMINIYHFGDLSGTFAFITQPLVAAIDDAISFYNDNGGVCGAMLAQTFEDTAGDLEATQAAYDRFREFEDINLLILYASADAELLREQLAEDETPVLISAGSVEGLYGEDGATPGWLYAGNPLYVNQMGSFCDYVAANPDQFPDPVMGYLSWPGAFGEAAWTDEGKAYCESVGVSLFDEPQVFLPTDTDIINQVLNLTDAGVNIVYTNTLASGPILISETLRALGLEGEIQLAGVNWILDSIVGGLSAQRAPEDQMPAVDGMLGSMPFYWWSEVQQPSVAFITEQFSANEREPAQQNIAYLITWGSINHLVELYIRAANEAGSLDAVTGASLKDLLDSIEYDVLLGLYNANYQNGVRDPALNRIARMAYLNADATGPAASRDEVGDNLIPIIVPLTDFDPVVDLRPGMFEADS